MYYVQTFLVTGSPVFGRLCRLEGHPWQAPRGLVPALGASITDWEAEVGKNLLVLLVLWVALGTPDLM